VTFVDSQKTWEHDGNNAKEEKVRQGKVGGSSTKCEKKKNH